MHKKSGIVELVYYFSSRKDIDILIFSFHFCKLASLVLTSEFFEVFTELNLNYKVIFKFDL